MITIECDGHCGKKTQNLADFKAFGFGNKKLYCTDCAPKAEEFELALSQLHTTITTNWSKQRGEILEQFKERYPDMEFPV